MERQRDMRGLRILLIVAAAGVIVALAGCGTDESQTDPSGDGAADPAGLDGREFWSTSVTEGGAARPLVDDTRIAINFRDGNIGATAGCNSMGATYRIDDGVLVVGDMFTTEIGCDPDRHAQDQFVAELLSSNPTIGLDGDQLTIASAEVEIELVDRAVADPDRPIIGTTWEVTGFIEGEAASSFAVDEPATLVFNDDSTLTGFDGCAGFTLPVEVADGSIGGPVEGDGELQFGPIVLDQSGEACPPETEQYRAMVQAVLVGQAVYTIEGPNLTILTNDNVGLTLRAS